MYCLFTITNWSAIQLFPLKKLQSPLADTPPRLLRPLNKKAGQHTLSVQLFPAELQPTLCLQQSSKQVNTVCHQQPTIQKEEEEELQATSVSKSTTQSRSPHRRAAAPRRRIPFLTRHRQYCIFLSLPEPVVFAFYLFILFKLIRKTYQTKIIIEKKNKNCQ